VAKESGANTHPWRTPVSIANQELSDCDARTQLTELLYRALYCVCLYFTCSSCILLCTLYCRPSTVWINPVNGLTRYTLVWPDWSLHSNHYSEHDVVMIYQADVTMSHDMTRHLVRLLDWFKLLNVCIR